jgi:peptidoglycan hydrolase-like protein with peptidoglycan-binding domain
MGQTTSQQRESWKQFECNQDAMTVIDFGPDRVRVAPPTADAFRALASVLLAHGYRIRVDDTDSYNCRAIKGGTGRSLHSYGIAIDVNWDTNPFKETPDDRAVRFSDKATQDGRAQDVKLGIADTDMTKDMIDDVLAIKTNNKKTVFEWGGNWKDRKDSMHYELDVSPADLQTGIDWSTVKQPRTVKAPDPGETVQVGTQLAIGSRGDAVKQLQLALAQRGYPVGDVDGIYGTQTAMAVSAFQARQGLAQTGGADDATLRALTSAQQTEGATMKSDDILRAIFGALLANQPTVVPSTPAVKPVSTAATQDVLQAVLSALMAKQNLSAPAQPVPTAGIVPVPTASVPVLSPIDQWLGGEAMAGKKTGLAVLAYSVLSILQAVGVAGTATGPTSTTTGQVLTTLIAAFGGLGLTSKIDRVVQTLGLIAAKPPSTS